MDSVDMGFLGARYRLECREQRCTLVLVGSYDEVLEEAVAHERRAHRCDASEDELRAKLRRRLEQESVEWVWPHESAAWPP